ncbi:MAG: transglycosylase SLT domain-containing protein [Burkholderiales bacterium]|nr:transglycosylase SLT domain-containing protein [Burkholderiales bacterium]
MTMTHHADPVFSRQSVHRAVARCAVAAAAVLTMAASARAESDPTHFNGHLAIFSHATAAVGDRPGPAAQPAAAAAPSAGRRPGRALGYEAGARNGVHGLIARHAAAQGIPVALADAVVRIESRYNPSARNAGAVGLMQIKPQTARGLGYQGGAAGLMHPETNVKYGMIYLAQAYRMSGGDTCTTLMRYQSGHYARRANQANRAYCAKARTIMASN